MFVHRCVRECEWFFVGLQPDKAGIEDKWMYLSRNWNDLQKCIMAKEGFNRVFQDADEESNSEYV